MRHPEGSLKHLNEACWTHYISSQDGSIREPLSDLDCLLVNKRVREQEEGRAVPDLELVDLTINVKTMEVVLREKTPLAAKFGNSTLKLIKSENNEKRRSEFSMKSRGDIFNIKSARETNFTRRPGEFGRAWVVKNNHKKTSSLIFIVNGLKKYFL